jgi:hypothetical protein
VRTDQKVSAYNRLQGMLAITDELVRLYNPPANVLAELLLAYQALKMAQNGLGWDPGQVVDEKTALPSAK